MIASNHLVGSIIQRTVGNEKRRSNRQPRSRGSLVWTGVADIGCCTSLHLCVAAGTSRYRRRRPSSGVQI